MLSPRDDSDMANPVPSMIAWTSICLLSAAWGPAMPAHLRTIWAYVGLFGLVASVALSFVRRARLAHEERKQQRQVLVHLEQQLTHIRTDKRTEPTPTQSNPDVPAACA